MGKLNIYKLATIILSIAFIISLIYTINLYSNSSSNYAEVLGNRNEVVNFYTSYITEYGYYVNKVNELGYYEGGMDTIYSTWNDGGTVFKTDYDTYLKEYEEVSEKVLEHITNLENLLNKPPEALLTDSMINTYKNSFKEHRELIKKNLEKYKETRDYLNQYSTNNQ